MMMLSTQNRLPLKKRASNSAFSLLEVIIVVALLAGVYSYALPQFRIFTGLEESSTLSRLTVDIRSAYDIAVLTGKVHRLVFRLDTGEYWLEMSDSNQIHLNVDGQDHDSTEYEEQEELQTFQDDFQIYEDMMLSPVYDPEDEVEIKLITPLIVAKEQLKPPRWTMVKNIECRSAISVISSRLFLFKPSIIIASSRIATKAILNAPFYTSSPMVIWKRQALRLRRATKTLTNAHHTSSVPILLKALLR